MTVHSIDASSLKAAADASVGSDAGTANPQPAMASGFRHFLDTPLASQRFRVFGIDPLVSPAHLSEIRALMNRLSRRMDAEIRWPQHGDPSIEHWENPTIPSGYTYLLQFIAHDLVHSAMPLSITGELGAVANARRAPLLLESFYGHGPVGSPHLYALDAPTDDRRTKLRLGRMRWKFANGDGSKDNTNNMKCPFRDIARTRVEDLTGIDRDRGARVALTEALVADPRNDDHAIISQLTALFALLHNGLTDIARRGEPVSHANGRFGAAYKRFLCARDALTAIYHHIIRTDVMRRVLHPAIHAAYAGANPWFMDRHSAGDWEIPFEFSHGAFRFGHAMVRPEYRINDQSRHDLNNTLEKSSANDPLNMPLDDTWMVQWSRFFPINDSEPNFSRRIGPYLSDALGNDQIFYAFDATERVGLLYRDLLGASLAGMWSVDALIAEIGRRRPDFVAQSRLLADRAYRVGALRQWLSSAPTYGNLGDDDIETISNDPPLPFFILFEAMQQESAAGLHLGPLGSIITAEVIFAALEGARASVGYAAGPLAAQLAQLSRNYYAANVFSEIPDIASMAQLVEWTAEIADLKQAVPAFL
ncbi:peroxidase family protein [Bradyrhizobium sp. Tv2a-2]|uniref:peroxidase family protein n=1 Tax=Bradyrhizobium sp. Tv2a-2 TaxID=113395 RepID=UPI000400330B|nr:peroxidase family protein [Bradyrhizobium sp. Tv2a-2]